MNTETKPQRERITDMRGSGYAANYIEIVNDRPYYCGSPFQDLIKDDSGKSNHYYNIIQFGVNVGTIAITDDDKKKINDLLNPIEFTRVNSDINGNPRFVCHFLAFLSPKDEFTSLEERYQLALKRSRQLGGRKFHNKQYGGGIVLQMYDGQGAEMSRKIREIANR